MAEQHNHLYLVDGSSYIFRAYHRLPPLTNRHGVPAGAVYGYTAMLWKLADGLNRADGPTHMAVILDKSSTTFRNAMYDQYKANRPPPPEDLKPQFPLIRTATRAFSIPCIETEGLEADDIIACYAKAALAAGWSTTIVSSDKDLMQLIEPGVDMLDTMNDRRIDADYVIAKFGVPPEKLGDVLALMGDSVDNVPGVPGIGPKTASQLINDFGSLEAVLAGTDSIKKPKLKQSLIDHADNARLSRELVRLECNAALPEPLEDLALKGIPPEPLREFLEDMGFKALLSRMVGGGAAGSSAGNVAAVMASAAPPAPVEAEKITVDRTLYETVTSEESLDRWIAEARHQGYVAIDTETDCIDCIVARLVGVSLATQPNLACYIPVGHGGGDLLSEAPSQLPLALVLGKLKVLLEDPAVLKIGHNLKYDLVMFAKAGIAVAPYDDTLVMSFDLDAGRSGHGMDELAKTHFEHECISFKSICGVGAKQITFDKVPLDVATEYAAEDADITLRLWLRLKPRVAAEGVSRVYETVDRPLVATIARMEQRGVKVDRDYLARLSGTFAVEIAKLEEQVFEAAEGPFTIGSPQQLGSVLFDRLGLKGGRKGKNGQYSTDVNELERLAGEGVPVARLVLEWRQLSKLRSTYTEALQAQINPDTGRVHTSFSLSGAQTGRLSSTEPNLQNIPIRSEIGRQIRDAFVAAPGHVLMSADYSQIELRLAAHMADVPQLKEAFAKGEDIHNMTAEELFGSVDRDTRNKAKTINFAILYGISSWGLAGRLGVSREEGKAIIDRYFQRFPGIQNYINETTASVRELGFTTTLFGRKTHFPNIRSPQQNLRQGSERAAINAPIQGTSADLIKRAMNRMDAALADAGLPDVRMLLQVHDELVFEVPLGQEEAAAAVVRDVMARAAEPALMLDVPLDVEVGWGEHWGRGALTDLDRPATAAPSADLAALARGGRINFMGFVLRLMARLPFLFIAGRIYGAEALGRFAYAVLIVEFAAQIATLGLKRGLAQQLALTDKPHACVVWDALLVAAIGSGCAMVLLAFVPQIMFPNSEITGLEWALPITVIALAWSDISLAALAYRNNVGATVRARAVVEPWTISIAAFAWSFISIRDGLIIAYAMSMIGAVVASMIPFLKSYGLPRGWSPHPMALWRMARRNLPVAAADAVEWGSRRIDMAVLGALSSSPKIVGIYYVAQQVASLPSKLKTSFDPILGPVISRNIALGDKRAVAHQVRQVGFWVIAAQSAVALALGIPGEGVMGLVGAEFVAGTAALAFLLGAEVVASTATVSEAALIYVARLRNMWLSLAMIALQAAMSALFIVTMQKLDWPIGWQATGPALALVLALGFAAIAKSRLLSKLLGAPVSAWRWPLIWAAAAATIVGVIMVQLPEWAELLFGIPAILAAFGAVLWTRGFGPEDRELFRMKKADIAQLELPTPDTGGDAPR